MNFITPGAAASNAAPLTDMQKRFLEYRARNPVPVTAFATPADKDLEPVVFLKAFDPQGWHNLVAIPPTTGAIEGHTFGPGSWDAMAQWIKARDGKSNLYFSVNEPIANASHKKLSKGDIAKIRALFVDLDPEKSQPFDDERARLKGLVDACTVGKLKPTFTIDSGGGFQLFWKLRGPKDAASAAQWAQAQGADIAAALGGDRVQNIDRIMRLPGTMNLPNASKKATGRVPRPAKLLHASTATFDAAQLRAAFPPVAQPAGAQVEHERIATPRGGFDFQACRRIAEFEQLDAGLRERFTTALGANPKLRALWSGEEAGLTGSDSSRSGFRLSLAHRLRRAGFCAQEYGQLLYAWDFAVNADEDHDDKLTAREILRAWDRAENRAQELATDSDPSKFFQALPPDEDDPFASAKAAQEANNREPQRAKRLELISIQEAASRAGEQSAQPLIKGLLNCGAMSILYGESNSGKTFVALDMAFHLAAGLPWAGKKTLKVPVVYVAAEGGSGILHRCDALRKAFPAQWSSADFQVCRAPVDLRNPAGDLKPLIAAINAYSQQLGKPVGLVVIDTLSRALAGGDENASTDMGALVKNFDAIRAQTGAHLLVVHHSGKDKAKGARGHSLLRAATDTEIEIADGEVKVTKQRDLDGGFHIGFTLPAVTLGRDRDGDPVTSCTVKLTYAAERPQGVPTPAEQPYLDAVRDISADGTPAASLDDVMEILLLENDDKTRGLARKHLDNLSGKHLLQKAGRAKWAVAPQRPTFSAIPAGALDDGPKPPGSASPIDEKDRLSGAIVEKAAKSGIFRLYGSDAKSASSPSNPERTGMQNGTDFFQ